MFYGLAHLESSFFADSLHKAVMLAPCFYSNMGPDCTTPDCVNYSAIQLQDLGIYNINGPHWDENLKTICSEMSESACYFYGSLAGRPSSSVISE